MERVTKNKTLTTFEDQAKKLGFSNVDVSTDELGDRMLEITIDPHSRNIHYHLNTVQGRKAVSRDEADQLIQEQY